MENSNELIEHREQLVRALRIALGYVKTVADKGEPTAVRHAAEIEAVLSGPVYQANSVLKRLGDKITKLKEEAEARIDEAEGRVTELTEALRQINATDCECKTAGCAHDLSFAKLEELECVKTPQSE